MFLSIVKNNKLHHFVRFNCMQASAGLRARRAAWLLGCVHGTCGGGVLASQARPDASGEQPQAPALHRSRAKPCLARLPLAHPFTGAPSCTNPPARVCMCARVCALQAIMLDIVVMLFHILRAYLPSELKWSVIGQYFDMFGWTCCMGTVLYAVFWTVR